MCGVCLISIPECRFLDHHSAVHTFRRAVNLKQLLTKQSTHMRSLSLSPYAFHVCAASRQCERVRKAVRHLKNPLIYVCKGFSIRRRWHSCSSTWPLGDGDIVGIRESILCRDTAHMSSSSLFPRRLASCSHAHECIWCGAVCLHRRSLANG